MEIAARLDDYGKPAWIAVMVLAFIVFWPIGLAILGYMIWSGRMGCWGQGSRGRWHYEGRKRNGGSWFRNGGQQASSGNHAFDEYREETLRRLEDEQKAFMEFLERLRRAKDKAEFDQFMAEHRGRSSGPDPEGFASQPQG